MVVHHLARVASDHCPLLLNIESGDFGGSKPFSFECMWAYISRSLEVVEENWDVVVCGSPTYVLTLKNKRVKNTLR